LKNCDLQSLNTIFSKTTPEILGENEFNYFINPKKMLESFGYGENMVFE